MKMKSAVPRKEASNILMLHTAIRVKSVNIIGNKLDLLSTSSHATKRLVPHSSPCGDISGDESNEKDAASHSQGKDRNSQILLLSHEICELLGIRTAPPVREGIPDIRGRDAPSGEERCIIGINRTLGGVARRKGAHDKEVRDDVLGATRLLGETRMSKAILLDEPSAGTQVSSDDGGVLERSGGVSLVSDHDDRVF